VKIAEADILVVPGLGNSGPGHWQRRWSDRIDTARIVEQADWDRPDRDEWVEVLARAVMMATRPVVFVAHSLGVHAVVSLAGELVDTKVRGAFLVAPPDLESEEIPDEARSFAPGPREPLPFPSILVASANDPLCSVERAVDMATCWGSDFHLAGDAGHINAASGHGPWPEGLLMFTRLMQRLPSR
jgi:predicted alpha/beta hydrolase family esterase